MNPFDDDENVTVDDLLAGLRGPDREPLAALLGQLRALADEPAPAPTPALAAVLRDGLPAVALDRPAAAAGGRSPVLRGLRWAAGLSLVGKVLLGAGVAAAAVAGTATLPVVPDSVQGPVRTALGDLGHLIPGPAGGSVPVPSVTTPEREDGATNPAGRPVPSTGVERDRPEATPEPGEDAPAATPGHDASPGNGPEAGDGNDQGGKPSAAPTSRPSWPPARPTQGPSHGPAEPTPTTPAADRGGSGSSGGEHG